MAGGYFLIKSQMHGLVMDVEGGQALPGTRVLMYHQKDTNNDNQLFREDKKTGTIRSKMDNLCLDLEGTQLIVNLYKPGNLNQQWVMAQDFIQSKANKSSVLDISNADRTSGAYVCLWAYNGGKSQKWRLVPAPAQRQRSGRAANRSGFSKPVQPQVPPLAQYPGVQPQYSGAYGNPYTGAPPPPYAATQQQQYPGATPQVAAPVVSPFPPPPHLRQYYIIQSQLSNLVLDIEEGCRNPGTRVVTWYMKAGDPKNQIFYEDSGTGTIRAKLNDLCFEIIDTPSGRSLVLNHYQAGNANQQWMIYGEVIWNRLNNLVLDIAGYERNISASICTMTSNQKWVFVKA